MEKYYLLGKEVSYKEWCAITGEEQDYQYIAKLYRNIISASDIPEDRREAVQAVVNNRIAKYGTYESHIISAEELKTLMDAFYKKQITRGEAIKLFESLEKMRSITPDSVASETVDAYKKLNEDGQLIKAGTRINWNGQIKRARNDMWDTNLNNPDNAPTLWEDINYNQGYRIIPEIITASAAFADGECGWWNDALYCSLVNNNVWTPDTYPAGWELLE